MARARGLASWQPRAKSLALLEQVNAVLREYIEHLPLTIRQIFYRLVGAYAYDKTEQAYDRLGEMLNRARRASFVRFDAIRDDGVDMRAPTAWNDADGLIEAIRNSITNFRLDRQRGQPRRLLIAVEAAGMLPQVVRIAAPYGIPVQSSGGFDSLTAKHALTEFLSEWPAAEVLHIGDHDPSGVHVFSSLAEDVRAICDDSEHAVDVTFTRLAVTPKQIATLGLPTAPPKSTDPRRFDGVETVQAEAIPPDVLAGDRPTGDRRSHRQGSVAAGAGGGGARQGGVARQVRRYLIARVRIAQRCGSAF
jgi:hypothetical protein